MDWIFNYMLNVWFFHFSDLTLLFLACSCLRQIKWRQFLPTRSNKDRFFWLDVFDVYVFSLTYGEFDGSCYDIFLKMELFIEFNQRLS